MKTTLLSLLLLFTVSAVAQPPARRKAEAQKSEKNNTPKGSAYREFPTAPTMPGDVSWRRDIYLSLDLTKEANAVLYYPTTPQDGKMNLFTYLFKLLLRGQIKAYDYKLDGNEHFTEANRVKVTDIMNRYKINFEQRGEQVRVLDADIPSEQVKLFYIKANRYFDKQTSSFRTAVTAICPVLKRGDVEERAGSTEMQFPMFWVRYSDVAPYLAKLMLMTSSLNNAAVMSADDYFTAGAYKGDIYKTNNLQDRLLMDYCPTDSDMVREQKRIDREMVDFQDHVWGRDSVAMAKEAAEKAAADSLAAAEKPAKSSADRRVTGRRSAAGNTSKSRTSQPKPEKRKKEKVSSPSRPSSGAAFSVRRQRH